MLTPADAARLAAIAAELALIAHTIRQRETPQTPLDDIADRSALALHAAMIAQITERHRG